MKHRLSTLRLSGLSGIGAVLMGFSAVLLSISSSPWFSWTGNALSDLGVGASGLIFNAGLAASGLLMIPFSLGLFELSKGCWIWKIGSYMFLLDAIFLMGVGIFHEGFGRIHFYFSLLFFILMPLSLMFMGISLWIRGIKGLGFLTLSAGLVTPAAWVLPLGGAAIPETISASATAIWMIHLSLKMLRSNYLCSYEMITN